MKLVVAGCVELTGYAVLPRVGLLSHLVPMGFSDSSHHGLRAMRHKMYAFLRNYYIIKNKLSPFRASDPLAIREVDRGP